ncbi:hypothetical protein V2J09_006786 [Rumex salicifolius]
MSMDAFVKWPSTSVRHLPKFGSDHTPLLFEFYSGFLEGDVPANEAHRFLKHKLLRWNRLIFGDVHVKKSSIVALIKDLQIQIQVAPSDGLLERDAEAQRELAELLRSEETLWRQKSWETWLKEGNRNTSYFHLSTLVRRCRNRVSSLLDEDDLGILRRWLSVSSVISTPFPLRILYPIVTLHNIFPRYHSLVGRITLVKVVISSIPIYSMAVLPLPVSTCEKIDKVMCSFIWGGFDTSRKMHMVNWEDITKRKEFGGLGIKRMEELNLALIGKLAWRFLHAREELWARVIRSKYIRPSLIKRSDLSSVWRANRRGVGLVVCKGSSWVLGNGRLIRSLKEWAISEVASFELDRRVWKFWTAEMGWRWDNFAHLLSNKVFLRIASLAVRDSGNEADCITWSRAQNDVYTDSSA